MIGRKLLLADDSVTIQKVIDLTFSDEGMQVVTVGDGEQAVLKLEEFTPDVILADVLMPGLDGYRLCEFIKQHDRYHGIPVMLLVGSFEPFDEAEARRVGADDFLTKPFQSIKQLVSRVGSLLGGKPAEEPANGSFSTLGLGRPPLSEMDVSSEATTAPLPETPSAEQNKASMELETADTQKLEPEFMTAAHANTIETKPVNTPTINQTTAAKDFGDVLLDLDDFDSAPAPESDDAILDLGYEVPAAAPAPSAAVQFESSLSNVVTSTEVARDIEPDTAPEAGSSDWAIVGGRTHVDESVAAPGREVATSELSAEAIDAIAQRVVEKLSDRVVREIAWEVVPELAELLIKQRMDENKS